MLQPISNHHNRSLNRRWIALVHGCIAVSFTWAMWLSADTAHATVIEYADDGTAKVVNLVKPEAELGEASKTPALFGLTPRKLSKLDVKQTVFRKLAIDTAYRYTGSDGVKAAGLDALTFVDVFTTLIHRESNYDPETVSAKGAVGLGQLLPSTAKTLGVQNINDSRENLDASARYFTQMLKRFGSLELALAAYNAGPTRVSKYGDVPPFRETRQYIIDILGHIGIKTDLSSKAVASVGDTPPTPRALPEEVQDKSKKDQTQGVQSVWEF